MSPAFSSLLALLKEPLLPQAHRGEHTDWEARGRQRASGHLREMGPSWGPSTCLDWPSPLRAVHPASPGRWEVAGAPAEMEAQAAAPPGLPFRAVGETVPHHSETTQRGLFTLFFGQHHLSSAIKITNSFSHEFTSTAEPSGKSIILQYFSTPLLNFHVFKNSFLFIIFLLIFST